ncbi:hypothetical protein HZS_2755 [Henneguya salminicola]|nr:hypothetical protein HZS_2755 [Henneguya salminicola]
MAKQNTQILILYGSETGNSEDYAYQIYRSIKPQFENCDLHEADSFNNINIFPEIQILIFVVSTSGQGSEPKNFKMFWKNLLQSRISTTWLSKSKFAVLGLGDSNYKRHTH